MDHTTKLPLHASAFEDNLPDVYYAPNSNPNDVSSSRRAQELYQYFHPLSFENSLGEREHEADQLLTSQAQLVALRLGGKCLLNFLDDRHQYIVAEADGPSLLELDDGHSPDPLNMPHWVDCRGMDATSNSVCQYTVEMADSEDKNEPPFFEVVDLKLDPRFAEIPLVSGQLGLRYYGGTPLYSKSGIAIGALVVVDDRVRKPMSRDARRFMRKTAKDVMRILELHRQSREQRRTSKMNKSLGRFATPWSSHPHDSLLRSQHDSSARHAVPNPPLANTAVSGEFSSASLREPEDASGMAPFPKAARLLREALDHESCGVVFLDTIAISTPDTGRNPQDRDGARGKRGDADDSPDAGSTKFTSKGLSTILAASFNSSSIWAQPKTKARRRLSMPGSFIPLPTDDLNSLAGRYLSGQLWLFDGEGRLCMEQTVVRDERKDSQTLNSAQWVLDGALLLQHIPQASAIFIRPIWNARSNRMVVALIYSSSQYRAFSPEFDVPFMDSFSNCVAVELFRLSAVAADRQKADFIGSISHELRSPLHGILASCELLLDTELRDSQQSLVETASSCGRTLLDTISMVLDWSKVNAFERELSKVRPSHKAPDAPVSRKEAPLAQVQPLPNLYGNVDLAAVVEEVVQGAVIGQGFQQVQPDIDFADLGAQARGRLSWGKKALASSESQELIRPPVEVFLQISSPRRDWSYITQPGAFRRTILNLVGNSLKYCKTGWVKVALSVQPGSLDPSVESPTRVRDMVTLTVEDTGKGISAEYLRTKLFVPFAQEDILAPGTGLGLSLTKSIVTMLEGDIRIVSTVGQGTKVTVTIPMLPRHAIAPGDLGMTPNTPPSAASNVSNPSEESDVEAVRRLSPGRVVTLLDDSSESADQMMLQMTRDCLGSYMRSFFDIEMANTWSSSSSASVDVIVVNDFDIFRLLDQLERDGPETVSPAILVLCTNASQAALHCGEQIRGFRLELLSKPYGPRRLARALRSCLERRVVQESTRNTPSGGSKTDPEANQTTVDFDLASGSLRDDLIGQSAKRGITFDTESLNASMAILSPASSISTLQPFSASPVVHEPGEFPFPGSISETQTKRSDVHTSMTLDNSVLDITAPPGLVRHTSEDPQPVERQTRLLLVDDNSLNLRLLSTYMTKLKYTTVATAADGRIAVNLFKAALDKAAPFDICFMDLSMPVLDGFGATREMRTLEEAHTKCLPPINTPSRTMIIALTGLASEQDQTAAFDAGVDLYMTKPAKFREVGRLLKNWEANSGTAASDRLPHGPVSGVVA